MARSAVSAAALTLIVCVGCTSGDDVTEATEPVPVDSSVSVGLVGDAVSGPWRLESVAGKRVTVSVLHGGCTPFDRVTVDETPSHVTIASRLTEIDWPEPRPTDS